MRLPLAILSLHSLLNLRVELKFLSFDPPDPGGVTGLRSNNYFACIIPPAFKVPNSLVQLHSDLHFYSVEEEY
jgi:hypothetical protein